MLDVMGVAVARLAARKLALAAVPAEQGTAHGTRYGAAPAPDVQNLTIGGVAQHHDAGIAGHAAGRLSAQVEAARLLDDGQAGVQVCYRSHTFKSRFADLERCRGNVRRGNGRLLRP